LQEQHAPHFSDADCIAAAAWDPNADSAWPEAKILSPAEMFKRSQRQLACACCQNRAPTCHSREISLADQMVALISCWRIPQRLSECGE
jgi:hypothetical protein